MAKFRIDTQIGPKTWKSGDVLFHDDTPLNAVRNIADDYQQRLVRENVPFSDIRIVLVHTITREVIDVVEVLGDPVSPESSAP